MQLNEVWKTRHLLNDKTSALKYLLGGRALFTVESRKTGKWFTYKVLLSRKYPQFYYVGVLTKNNKFMYICCLYKLQSLLKAKKIDIRPLEDQYKIFKWVYSTLILDKFPNNTNFYHHGTCAYCGRFLTTPKSIEYGVGPICRKRKEGGK